MKKIKQTGDKVFFTSDIHFGHEWILNFNNRPFHSVEEMDEALIKNWNNTVPADGLTFVLGDIGIAKADRIVELFSQLNGDKILIRGNHDDDYKDEILLAVFLEIHDLLHLRVLDNLTDKYNYMVLCHYPMIDWQNSFRGTWQLFGHVHTRNIDAFDTFKTNLLDLQYDVGVDNNHFCPVSFHQVKAKIEQQKNDTTFKQSNY